MCDLWAECRAHRREPFHSVPCHLVSRAVFKAYPFSGVLEYSSHPWHCEVFVFFRSKCRADHTTSVCCVCPYNPPSHLRKHPFQLSGWSTSKCISQVSDLEVDVEHLLSCTTWCGLFTFLVAHVDPWGIGMRVLSANAQNLQGSKDSAHHKAWCSR